VVRPQQLQHQQHRQKLNQQSTTAIAIAIPTMNIFHGFKKIKEWHCTQPQKQR